MIADRADLRSLGAYDDMTAVAAFPDRNTGFFENFTGIDVRKQFAIAFFMGFLNCSDTAELFGQVKESFFFRFFGHSFIHVGPLCIFAFGCGQKVCGSIADTIQGFEPQFGMLFFVFGGSQEQGSDLLIAGLLGGGSKVA